MNQLKDEELMLLVANGNLDMSKYLFDRYHVKIFNYCLKMTGNRQISQDITQEAFYKIIKHRKTFKENNFSSWIYAIARNLCYDYFKLKRKGEESLGDSIVDIADDTKLNDKDNGSITQLNIAMSQLNIEDKELIIMSKFRKLRYHEIAEIINSTEGAVKTKTHRAMKKLKDFYFKK